MWGPRNYTYVTPQESRHVARDVNKTFADIGAQGRGDRWDEGTRVGRRAEGGETARARASGGHQVATPTTTGPRPRRQREGRAWFRAASRRPGKNAWCNGRRVEEVSVFPQGQFGESVYPVTLEKRPSSLFSAVSLKSQFPLTVVVSRSRSYSDGPGAGEEGFERVLVDNVFFWGECSVLIWILTYRTASFGENVFAGRRLILWVLMVHVLFVASQ